MRDPAAATLRSAVLAQVVVLAAACVMAQAPFELDTTFRTEIEQQYVNSVALLSDGRLLISGQIRFPGDIYTRGSAILLSDGSRDPAFTGFVGQGKIIPWSDEFYVGVGAGVRRLLGTGYLDPTFILMNNGPYFASGQGGDYHVFPDGRVLMSGNHTLNDTARGFVGMHQLIWFSNQGYLDTTRVHRKGNGAVYDFCELPNGGFICSGYATQFDGHAVDGIFRVHADGSVDTTFHTGVNWGRARSFVPLADGRVYAGGRFRAGILSPDTFRLVRFLEDGSMDPAFNLPQFSLGSLPNNGGLGPQVLGVQGWGARGLLITGHFQYVNGEPRRGICILDSTGVLQDAFNDCGIGPFTYMGLTNGSLNGLMPDADSTHYYVWGTYNGYSDGTTNDPLQRFVTRLHVGDITTGSAPLSFGEGPGVRVYPNPSSGSATLQLDQVPRDAQVVLRDALGKEVLRQRIRDHYTTLALERSGLYTLEVLSGGERVSTQRVVVE